MSTHGKNIPVPTDCEVDPFELAQMHDGTVHGLADEAQGDYVVIFPQQKRKVFLQYGREFYGPSGLRYKSQGFYDGR